MLGIYGKRIVCFKLHYNSNRYYFNIDSNFILTCCMSCILLESSFWFDTINFGESIVHNRGVYIFFV